MLLSQSVQAKLGFLKSVRNGTIVMEDYDGQNLEVARQVRTGLFMIRIDHLRLKDFGDRQPPKLRALVMKNPLVVDISEDESTSRPTAFVNTEVDKTEKRKIPKPPLVPKPPDVAPSAPQRAMQEGRPAGSAGKVTLVKQIRGRQQTS